MELLSGNEAVAWGAWEAGVHIGAAYPGTPSTETMEAFAAKDDVYAEWCPNEKVALEVALGASAAGARVLVTMKHVGVNVAADPLFTAAYTGIGGGMLIMAADDPGMHSSQNEQDSRFYALAAHIPLIEPADSQEAHDFAKEAYELSEKFDTPFILRSTVRISHTKTPVVVGQREKRNLLDYNSDPTKWVMMPAFAKPRRKVLDERIASLKLWADETHLNTIEMNGSEIGIICAGATYQYVKEALPQASILKLGVTWPLPAKTLQTFSQSVEQVFVVEEASDYLSTQVRALGVNLSNPLHSLPVDGELTPMLIRESFGLETPTQKSTVKNLPNRPPALCPGCPHRLVFKELKRARAIITGDIGCYTLGALPPLSAMDTCVDMGASISMAHGFDLAFRISGDKRPVVGVIGDSTFAHSGLTSLLNTVYNQGGTTVAILDNRTTAMTGRQGNPFNGETLQGRPTKGLDIEAVVAALGVEDIQVVDPHDAKSVRSSLKSAMARPNLSVIVFRAPCVLIEKCEKTPYQVLEERCTSCGICTTLGCPAIAREAETGIARIDEILCIGCGQCAQYCTSSAIVVPDER